MGDERIVYNSIAEYERACRKSEQNDRKKREEKQYWSKELSKLQKKPIEFYENINYEQIEKMYVDVVIPHEKRIALIRKILSPISAVLVMLFRICIVLAILAFAFLCLGGAVFIGGTFMTTFYVALAISIFLIAAIVIYIAIWG